MKALNMIGNILAVTVLAGCGLTFIALIVLCTGAKLIWLALLEFTADWTGYTHQWSQAFAQSHREICMASADSIEDRDLARSMGWRTFRVIPVNAPMQLVREIPCPASPEGGNRKQCIDCGACDGALKPSSVSIAIVAHGKAAAHV